MLSMINRVVHVLMFAFLHVLLSFGAFFSFPAMSDAPIHVSWWHTALACILLFPLGFCHPMMIPINSLLWGIAIERAYHKWTERRRGG